jgi:RNA polymerase sigma-70 factor (ECF subfamily)
VTEEERQLDERLAAELIERYQRRVYRLARRLAAGGGIEDDIFQNAFVRAFRWIRKNPAVDLSNLEGFMLRCTRLAAIDLHRQKSRTAEVQLDVEPAVEAPGESRLIARLDLERSIAELPEKQRSVVALTLEGFTEREIAAILGISLRYAGVLMVRGRASLRTLLKGTGQPGQRNETR